MDILVIAKISDEIIRAIEKADNFSNIKTVNHIEEAVKLICTGESFNMIMIDVKLDIGLLFQNMHRERIYVDVVACGINPDIQDVTRAIKQGAQEYIPLPPDGELIVSILSAISAKKTEEIDSKSPKMKGVMQIAKQVAPSNASILITGESGTGKEVLSHFIHENSNRSNEKIVSVNCAAIPGHLIESELFGHEKGAFTGALSRRIGKFEEASKGTLLLDEITEMDINLQAKLLRAIQELEISRLGSNEIIKLNTRVIATSNRTIEEEVKNNKFREDLFFRLNVVNICIPPLRDRKEDIENMSKFFVDKFCKLNGLPIKTLSSSAIEKLILYEWPGNVREMENKIHKAVLLSIGNVIEDIETSTEQKCEKGQQYKFVGSTLHENEKVLILNTIDQCMGNKTKAAEILGISIRTLRNKLKEYSH